MHIIMLTITCQSAFNLQQIYVSCRMHYSGRSIIQFEIPMVMMIKNLVRLWYAYIRAAGRFYQLQLISVASNSSHYRSKCPEVTKKDIALLKLNFGVPGRSPT